MILESYNRPSNHLHRTARHYENKDPQILLFSYIKITAYNEFRLYCYERMNNASTFAIKQWPIQCNFHSIFPYPRSSFPSLDAYPSTPSRTYIYLLLSRWHLPTNRHFYGHTSGNVVAGVPIHIIHGRVHVIPGIVFYSIGGIVDLFRT